MQYDIDLQVNDDHLRFEVTGERRPAHQAEDGFALWQHITSACRTHDQPRFVVLLNMTGPLPTMASFQLGADLERLGWEPRFKAALVNSDDETRKASEFAVTVAANRAAPNARVFADEEAALDWLLGD